MAMTELKKDPFEMMTSFGRKARARTDTESPILGSRRKRPRDEARSSLSDWIDCEGKKDRHTFGSDEDSDGHRRPPVHKKSASVADDRRHGATNNTSYDSSSDDDDENDEDLLDRKLRAMRNRDGKIDGPGRIKFLKSVSCSADAALQCILWESGFGFDLFPHQFEGVRKAAGLGNLPNFPGSDPDLVGFSDDAHRKRGAALRDFELKNIRTRGLLLADSMGLGKTVESLGAAILRDRLYGSKNIRRLPTIIVSPNDAVTDQWRDALMKAGANPSRVCDFKGRTLKKKGVKGGDYILLTRYDLQSEVKRIFERETKTKTARRVDSILFPSASPSLFKKLRNQYLAANAKERNKETRKNETKEECLARLFCEVLKKNSRDRVRASFRTVIIDEAHFLKNVLTFWGIGAALLGVHSQWTLPLSGTPFNNGPQDMASLMTFIDPNHEASHKKWWIQATEDGSPAAIKTKVQSWSRDYMLRRGKEAIQGTLPPITRGSRHVGVYSSELDVYEAYEEKFLTALERLNNLEGRDDPDSMQEKNILFQVMMATMSCQRMSLIHPILPGGREVTIQFSPSRRHLKKSQERPHDCVCCVMSPTEASDKFVEKKEAKKETKKEAKEEAKEESKSECDRDLLGTNVRVRDDLNLDDQNNDDQDDDDDEEGVKTNSKQEKYPAKGPIVAIDGDMCCAGDSECRHYAHEECLEILRDRGAHCPRCQDLQRRVHISSEGFGRQAIRHKIYCKDISTAPKLKGGFTASAKIERVIEWFQTNVPTNDKALILSFFKGGLDLLEGILVDDLGIGCARFDGDVTAGERARELKRFKTKQNCRVLLATVQCGGTGLNIVEANHVCFLDRWFNPCVHAQAEDRCHRIRQTKAVSVQYFDSNMTVDEVMATVNKLKSGNASILLADGTALGAQQSSVSYRDISGVIGQMMREIRVQRLEWFSSPENKTLPLPCADEERLKDATKPKREKQKSSKITMSEADMTSDSQESISSSSSDDIISIPDSAKHSMVHKREYASKTEPVSPIEMVVSFQDPGPAFPITKYQTPITCFSSQKPQAVVSDEMVTGLDIISIPDSVKHTMVHKREYASKTEPVSPIEMIVSFQDPGPAIPISKYQTPSTCFSSQKPQAAVSDEMVTRLDIIEETFEMDDDKSFPCQAFPTGNDKIPIICGSAHPGLPLSQAPKCGVSKRKIGTSATPRNSDVGIRKERPIEIICGSAHPGLPLSQAPKFGVSKRMLGTSATPCDSDVGIRKERPIEIDDDESVCCLQSPIIAVEIPGSTDGLSNPNPVAVSEDKFAIACDSSLEEAGDNIPIDVDSDSFPRSVFGTKQRTNTFRERGAVRFVDLSTSVAYTNTAKGRGKKNSSSSSNFVLDGKYDLVLIE